MVGAVHALLTKFKSAADIGLIDNILLKALEPCGKCLLLGTTGILTLDILDLEQNKFYIYKTVLFKIQLI